MDKAQIEQGKKMAKLLDKAMQTNSVDEAIEMIRQEPLYSVSEKYAMVFQIGRIYERQLFDKEIQQTFQQMKKEEAKNVNNKDKTDTGSV